MALRTIRFGAGFTGRGSDEEIVVDMEGSVSQMHDGARWRVEEFSAAQRRSGGGFVTDSEVAFREAVSNK